LLTPLLVAAQQSQPPTNTPPKLEKLEESEPPSIKFSKPEDKNKVTETREGGQVKVQTGGSTYYVKPNEQQVGNSLPGDTESSSNHGVQWKVLEFDLGSKIKKSDDSQTPSDSAAPSASSQK
jgi:hypothetical protein